MPLPKPDDAKLLLVEDADDEHVICHLYQRAGNAVDFSVNAKGGIQEVIQSIRNEALVSGRISLGVVVDANDKLEARWQEIRNQFISVGIRLPPHPTADGTVVKPELARSGLPKVGVWLMPDNSSDGELEDFLSGLVPPDDPIWPLARTYIYDAFEQLVPRQPKRSKAEVHAWLAGKNSGLPMGLSVRMGLFDDGAPTAQAFLVWLREVFG